jgi:hypothetical protein
MYRYCTFRSVCGKPPFSGAPGTRLLESCTAAPASSLLDLWPTANGPLQDLRQLRSMQDVAPGLVRLPVSEDRVARPVSLMRRCGRVPECMSAEEFGIIAKSYGLDPPDDSDSLVLHPFHLPSPHLRPRHHERTPSNRYCRLHENIVKTPPG